MTRISLSSQKTAITALMDLFEMCNQRDPEHMEVVSLLETVGTHGSIVEDVAVYADDELLYVHTMNTAPSSEKDL
ncbi:MAG: hypothetical protein ACXQTE_03370 [Methanosarcinaceae archaeon]